ncbi:MAG: DUF4198 domain-containing protein [Pyrinomonadaceae bacterium]
MKIKILFALFFLFLLSLTAFAHEYWFEPETFFLAPNQKTAVHLYVGDGLIKDREERAFELAKTTEFQLFSVDKMLDLKTSLIEGAIPIYNFSAAKAGNYLLAMERNWSYIKIEPKKFEDYLREDGMEYIIAEREKLGEREKEGRERYSRFIKSLLQVGDKRDATYKKQIGMKLEIMPLENPYSKKIGDSLNFQVLFDGKPLADRTVFADNRASETQKMTTDKNGRVTMKIDNKGLWLVRLVNMRRCRQDCGEADWESFWGALSFGVEK